MTSLPGTSPSASAEGSLDLREFLQKVTRRKWLILVSWSWSHPARRRLLLFAPEGLLVHAGRPRPTDPRPAARHRPAGQPQHADRGATGRIHPGRRLMATRDRSWEAPSDRGTPQAVSVATPDSTQILQISFKDSGAESARRGAQGFARGYLAVQGDQAETRSSDTRRRCRVRSPRRREHPGCGRRDQGLADRFTRARLSGSERESLEATRLGLQSQQAGVVVTSARTPVRWWSAQSNLRPRSARSIRSISRSASCWDSAWDRAGLRARAVARPDRGLVRVSVDP